MRDSQIKAITRSFRRGLLGRGSSRGMCFAVCAPLAGYLKFVGVDAEMVESNLPHSNHFWLRLKDGRALDPTFDQFEVGLPAIYLGPPHKFFHQTKDVNR